jgi:MurNAc alpha-1-phosphate uridylyltransferase
MILAAGRGERMRPLSDTCPKPLLEAGGKALAVWQIERLVQAGVTDIVINHAHLGALIEERLGDGSRWGARVAYSPEAEALETLGGIVQALPLLGDEPFVVLSGDIHTDYDYASLHAVAARMAAAPERNSGHLVLVENPDWHAKGDMGLANGLIAPQGTPRLTYANIAVFHPALFAGLKRGEKMRLFPWLYQFAEEGRVTGEVFRGRWDNVGTPAQLADLDAALRQAG